MASAWTAQERESFFDAIARHRRAAWQVAFVSYLCALILAAIVALLMAPLFYAVIGLALDVVNLALPMPDLLGSVLNELDTMANNPDSVPPGRWLYVTFVAALPGLVAMALVMFALHRIVREAETGGAQALAGRAPRSAALEEQRFANVIEEMALAAGIPAPRLVLVESAAPNAAAFGADEAHATIAATTGLLELLDRAQMQGVAGHLVGLIANGDVPQGLRVAQTLSLFGLVARLGDAVNNPQVLKRFVPLARDAFRRGASGSDAQLILELTDPFTPKATRASSTTKLTWREWLSMPLYGPIVMSGFFGGLVANVLLEPLLALAWRRRKYMADAIAMQFTRDADALAGALAKLQSAMAGGALPAWTTHMALAEPGMYGGMLGSGVALFPSLERRVRALGRMGSQVRICVPGMPLWMWALSVPVGAVVAILLAVAIYLLVLVSIGLSMIFTGIPTMLLHALLRWLA